ncbi:MAG: phosphoenolpyruvate--protein phosphotransferase [Kiloniellales bacterium]|nr:phosphoenolpyruvate--protein phosphotransferase [Kiloniellales bacterium]
MSSPPERVIGAEVAAPGLAMGVIHRARPPRWQTLAAERRPVEEERKALDLALRRAAKELEELAAEGDETAAEILAFQIAMLADPELVAPAQEAMAGGEPAAGAFGDALNIQIQDYQASGDDYFQARAEDLIDLRDRVLVALGGENREEEVLPERAIVVAGELTPSRFLDMDWTKAKGVALAGGSANSHVAMLARARGVPFLINLASDPQDIEPGAEAVIDAEQGCLILRPTADRGAAYSRQIADREAVRRAQDELLSEPAVTADGTGIAVLLNVDDPTMLQDVDPDHCDGIGLTRTEFLFGEGLPDEERQYRIYRGLLYWAGERPVTVRTLDAGADKPIPGLTPESEANPFLGVRGVRLSLAHPEVFRVQLRALARAACHGRLKVMVPMVATPDELDQARALMTEAVTALKAEGTEAAMPAFGMMVETPAAALAVESFASDFFSIGTNDLVQYVMAASRDSLGLKYLQDPLNPAVLELIARVSTAGAAKRLEVSVCGEMASLPAQVPALLDAGIRTLSVPPAALGLVKAAVRAHRIGSGRIESHG